MTNYDISIIMPSFNSEKSIGKAIDSIFNQETDFSFELLVIDDGSSDDTVNIIKSRMLQNKSIQLFYTDHKYQAEARNQGIKHASGKYIMFSDDDDEYLPGYIQAMGEKIKDMQLVIAGIEKQFPNGRVEVEDQSVMETATSDDQLLGDYLTKNQEMDVGLWNKIFVKKIIDDNHILMSNKNFFEDSLFVLQYLLAINWEQIGYVNQPMYLLNKHEGSTTNTYDPELLDKCNEYIDKVSKLIANRPELEKYFRSFKARIDLFYVHRNILNNPKWDVQDQRLILRPLINSSYLKELSKKYVSAIMLAFMMPKTYIKLYSKRK
ncbi:glycosyltransferase family 2 protein [Fructilactobacillus fructivorans]|uniref:Glycosyltransferase n=1 Tax=Fructilactobacillus fructivorans TaxID=1614 RepID=A0AAE6TW01_9LACO|nr:glycosyltransferase family 2 protein [Fructilactobacillus fructivorans]KRK58214.1 glycosyl transferase family 2 [Fructilactobacillus fructivorans]QFX92202.1 glycosyltransferase [Fructilactobacillus fructivorans]RDV65251.1 glycosyltransferase family 2 protein [Fructilactobacillus fructivorans]